MIPPERDDKCFPHIHLLNSRAFRWNKRSQPSLNYWVRELTDNMSVGSTLIFPIQPLHLMYGQVLIDRLANGGEKILRTKGGE